MDRLTFMLIAVQHPRRIVIDADTDPYHAGCAAKYMGIPGAPDCFDMTRGPDTFGDVRTNEPFYGRCWVCGKRDAEPWTD